MSTTLVRFFPCIQTEALYGHLLLKSGTLGLSWCFFRCCATPPPPFFLFFFSWSFSFLSATMLELL